MQDDVVSCAKTLVLAVPARVFGETAEQLLEVGAAERLDPAVERFGHSSLNRGVVVRVEGMVEGLQDLGH